jgi:hypothetical protein
MALKLYRRHRKECEGGHLEDSRSGEFEEGRRGWKKCACLIHVSGTLAGKFNRKQTGKSDWDEAKALVASCETADSWDGNISPPPPPELAPVVSPGRITIADAIKVFLTNRQGSKIAPATLRKYKTFTNSSAPCRAAISSEAFGACLRADHWLIDSEHSMARAASGTSAVEFAGSISLTSWLK